jgi:hypothetical protein
MKSIKHVNVGTVGHIDHGRVLRYTGRRNYLDVAGDWGGDQQYMRRLPNPFQPEWIYWLDGLVVVAGRVLHDANIYDEENPSGKRTIVDPGIIHDEPPQFMLDGKGGIRGMGNAIGKSSLVLEAVIAQWVPGYMSATDKVYRRQRNKERLIADRTSIIPSRKSIQWAIEMTHWKDKDLFKILGMDQLVPKQLEQLRWSRKDV